MFQVHKNMSTELMQGPFVNLRNLHHLDIPGKNSVYHGSESITNLGPRLWNLLPDVATSNMKLKDGNLNTACVRYVRTIYLALVFCNSLQVT